MPPNVIYLHSHDTGRSIQPYGHAIPTPNLQRLAEEGILFRQAYSAAPTCSPSRAALLTGQCAHSSGMLGLAHRGFSLTDPSRHLANLLRNAGYTTILCGVQHCTDAKNIAATGYDHIAPSRNADQVAVDFLGTKPTDPFFLDVGFFETHRDGRGFSRPGDEPGDGGRDARYVRPPAPLPDHPAVRQDMADFMTSAARLDARIGRVLTAIHEAGLCENTLVIYTTDHGMAFPRMKCSLTGHGLGVSLILRGPGGFSGGKICDALVSQVDLFPTLCQALELTPPAWLQGHSLMPLIRGEQHEVRQAIFGEVTFHAAFEPKRTVRTLHWSYIRNYDARRRPVLPNCDDSPTKDLLIRAGWPSEEIPEEQLFNLLLDPNERVNRAADPGCAAILKELRERLDQWMTETSDPLLLDQLPVSPDILVNDPDGLSPNEEPVRWGGGSKSATAP